jgi:flagellar biosynthesis protein FlhF
MQLETFHGRDITSVLAVARRALGDDATILEVRASSESGRSGIEVIAVSAGALDRLVQLVWRPMPLPQRTARPRVVALVGPTGAGKTTTLAKLATHPRVFGNQRVSLLTLDTHRAAGFEQLNAYAEASGLPCAIAYDRNEVDHAMRRFAGSDIVLVDTAGRGPASARSRDHARALLAALRPDEVHLVVPATLRLDLVARVRADHLALRPTHAILTKLDEVPGDRQLSQLTAGLDLPMRWVADGQDVPSHLRPAGGAILSPLGLTHFVPEAA